MLIIPLLALFFLPAAGGVTGFTNDQDMYFTGTSSAPGTLYQDAIDGNSDIGIELCGQGQRYVGAFYAIDVLGTWNYVLTTYNDFSNALALTTNDLGGGCYSVTAGFLTVSPSELTTPDPDVKKAAFPGRVYIGHAASANPGTLSSFEFGSTSAQYLGDYSVTRSFDQSTRVVSVSTPTITFTTSSSAFAKSASDASYGIADDRRMVIGLCTDTDGGSCSDGNVFTSATFPASLSSGLTAGQVNDQNTYTRYVVINGLGKAMCFGANLDTSVTSVAPDPVYYSQDLVINYTISNPRDTPDEVDGGNVDVTTDFIVNVRIYNTSNSNDIVYNANTTITSTIVPGGSVSGGVIWPAFGKSGTYTVRVEADVADDVNECNEGDNTDTDTFELRAVTVPDIYIDGVLNDTFPYPNIPYDFLLHLKNSDNLTLVNATVVLTEHNGLTMLAPTQIYNRSIGGGGTIQDGVVTDTVLTFITDAGGNASMVFIPTFNKLYLSQYNYTNLSGYIGNYTLNFTGTELDGDVFRFVVGGSLLNDYPLQIANTSWPVTITDKTFPRENIVSQVLDFLYQTYTNYLDTILS